jgi:hypothetical protein
MEYYWKKLMAKFNIPENEVEDSPIKTKIRNVQKSQTLQSKITIFK